MTLQRAFTCPHQLRTVSQTVGTILRLAISTEFLLVEGLAEPGKRAWMMLSNECSPMQFVFA